MTILTPHARLQNHPTNRKLTVKSCDTPTHILTQRVIMASVSLLEGTLDFPPQNMKNPLSIVPEKKKPMSLMQYKIAMIVSIALKKIATRSHGRSSTELPVLNFSHICMSYREDIDTAVYEQWDANEAMT